MASDRKDHDGQAEAEGIPLFAELGERDLDTIATFAQKKSFGAGEELVREGDFSYDLIAIEDGTAEVLRGGERVAELVSGDFVGEVGVMANELRSASVRATSGMRVVVLSTWDVKRLRKMPGVVARIEEAVAARAQT